LIPQTIFADPICFGSGRQLILHESFQGVSGSCAHRGPHMSEMRDSSEPDDALLSEFRDAIDEVDREILVKLNERARLVVKVGDLKQASQSPVYSPGRERDLVARLERANSGPFPEAGVAPVFREIISATRSLEERVRVAYLGPEGTFSQLAALRQFGAQVDLVAASSMSEVIALCERGAAHYSIVPVENTIEGAVTQTIDALVEAEVTICGELLLEISLNLLNRSGKLSAIRRLTSHPQPLAQCRRWLANNLPQVEIFESSSTAAAAQMAVEDPEVAAIGGGMIADAFDLQLVAEGIEDERGNSTRFLVVGLDPPPPSGNDLTSAVFTVRRDQSGALLHLLEPFARYDVSLTSLQSRPMLGKPWEYLFFLDLEGHQQDEAVGKALDEAAARAHSHKILGSFPRAQSKRRLGERS
jgi:chorismate mutase/prephenate dehydratase